MTPSCNNTMTIYVSSVRGKKTNTSYPYKAVITCAGDLAQAAKYDHVSAEYRDSTNKKGEVVKCHRANEDFVGADNVNLDCDNKNSNPLLPDIPPEEWKTPADVRKAFPGVAFYAVPSRNHMKVKDGLPARPKHHYYFPCKRRFANAAEWRKMKERMIEVFPAFDENAKDPARFMYGVEQPQAEFYPGELTIDEYMDKYHPAEAEPEKPVSGTPAKKQTAFTADTIPAGTRNSTLASVGMTLAKKYGIDDGKAYDAFMQTAAKCAPPLDDNEVQTIWNSVCSGYKKKVAGKADYIAPAEYAAMEFNAAVEPDDYTDVGQARVFVEQYGGRVRYSAATKWLVYDGRKWDESELQAQKLAQELTDRQLADARTRLKKARAAEDAAIEAGDDDAAHDAHEEAEAAKAYRAFVLGRRKTSRIAATLTEARPAVEIRVSDLDRDGFLLNTPGGTVDLRTGAMRPHDPNDYLTKMTAVAPSLDGMGLWLDFLDRLTCGDRDLQEYLQVCSGMEAVGNVYVEKLTVAYGSGGNGKSSFYNAKARVLGDYYGGLSSETLTANCRKNKSPEYAELRGKRLVIAAELEEGMRLDTAIVKKLCSTDPIKAEKKFKDPFDFIPSHSTVLYTNHLPKVGTNDTGTWDRLVVIPFNARFRGTAGEIFNYAEYLLENCGGAILTWIIEGARKFIAAKFHIKQPDCVTRAIDEYRNDNDWLKDFIEECCMVSPEYTVRAGDLFDAYRTHTSGKHEWARTAAVFKAAVTVAGYNWRKTSAGALYYGLKLKPEFEPIIPL